MFKNNEEQDTNCSIDTSVAKCTPNDDNSTTDISVFTGILELEEIHSFSDTNGIIWFVIVDVCKAVGLSNPRDVYAKLHPFEKGHISTIPVGLTDGSINVNSSDYITNLRNGQIMNVITEGGLYHLLGSSRKPEAVRFLAWINNVLLPQMRKLNIQALSNNNGYPPDYKEILEILPP